MTLIMVFRELFSAVLGDRDRERIEAAQDERIPAGRLACGRDLREPVQ
jgi:hypothetical protein